MKNISVRFLLPRISATAPKPYHEALEAVVVSWNEKRTKAGGKPVLGTAMVGSMYLPPCRDDKGYRIAAIAEFCGHIGVDHGAIYTLPEVARDELAALAAALDAELVKREVPAVLGSEITVGFCVWPRDIDGKIGQMKNAA